MITIAIILSLFCFVVDAKIQSDIIAQGVYPDHFKHAVIAFWYCLFIAFFTHAEWQILTCLMLLLSLRWIIFDILLNLFRGKEWNYVGIKDKSDAKMDLFLLKLPNYKYTQFIPKILLLTLSIYLYIIL